MTCDLRRGQWFFGQLERAPGSSGQGSGEADSRARQLSKKKCREGWAVKVRITRIKITAGFVQPEGEQREEESNLVNSAWNEKGVKEQESPWAL